MAIWVGKRAPIQTTLMRIRRQVALKKILIAHVPASRQSGILVSLKISILGALHFFGESKSRPQALNLLDDFIELERRHADNTIWLLQLSTRETQ
jgi:hypothetical protein